MAKKAAMTRNDGEDINEEDYRKAIDHVARSRSSAAKEDDSSRDPFVPVSAFARFPFTPAGPAGPSKDDDDDDDDDNNDKIEYQEREIEKKRRNLETNVWSRFTVFSVLYSCVALIRSPTLSRLFSTVAALLPVSFFIQLILNQTKALFLDTEAAQFEERSRQIRAAQWPESLEWFNALFSGIWARIPAESFTSIADMLEDTIQANLPTFITEVKCAELTQGKNPMKVLSARVLPPTEEDEQERKDNGGVAKHINLEIAFAYRAKEGSSGHFSGPTKNDAREIGPKHDNVDASEGATSASTSHALMGSGPVHDARILFLFQVKMGPKAFQLPVKVLLNGLVGIAKVRLELTSSSPFLGEMQLSFLGLPRVSVDIVPLSLSLAKVPGLGHLIQSSIDSALRLYTSPETLTVNIGEALMGDGIKRETEATGVVVVTVHSAHGLERADLRGLSDPYAKIMWSRTATSAIQATRVINKELNPVWEQSFALVVSAQVQASMEATSRSQDNDQEQTPGGDEAVCVEIWDSDVADEDDFLGKTSIPLKTLFARKGEMIVHEETLHDGESSKTRGGMLRWSAGYFEKRPVEKLIEERESQNVEASKPGNAVDENADKLEDERRTNEAKEQRARSLVEKYAPSKGRPLGILAIQIKSIAALKFKNNGSNKQRTDEDEEKEAPSSYVEVILADKRVYKSRTKMDDAEPCFNAVTEQVCDWMASSCLFVVRENRVAGKNDILGVVAVKLSDCFERSSLVTRMYPLAGGKASGRLHISLLFRSLDLHLGRLADAPRLVPAVGVLNVYSVKLDVHQGEESDAFHQASVKLSTLSSTRRFPSTVCEANSLSYSWSLPDPKVLAVFRRDASALTIAFRRKKDMASMMGVKSRKVAVAILWLNQVPDCQRHEGNPKDSPPCPLEFTLPLWRYNEDIKGLQKNWVGYGDTKLPVERFKATQIGTVKIQLDFVPGMSYHHGRNRAKKTATVGDSSKVFESWQTAVRAEVIRPLGGIKNAEEGSATSDSSSESSDGEEKDHEHNDEKEREEHDRQMKESGSSSQFFRRFVHQGDSQGGRLKDEVLQGMDKIRSHFDKDGDKATGLEKEV